MDDLITDTQLFILRIKKIIIFSLQKQAFLFNTHVGIFLLIAYTNYMKNLQRKIIFWIVAGCLVVGLGWLGWFFYNQLRGVSPIIFKSNVPIEKYFEESLNKETKNSTNFPLNLPAGVEMSIFANNLGKPRVMEFDPNGNLLVSIPAQGRVVRLVDTDSNGKADNIENLLTGLNKPHGMAVRVVPVTAGGCKQENCQLFVAEEDRLSLYIFSDTGEVIFKKILTSLPSGGNHTSRSLYFIEDPDPNNLTVTSGRLLVAMGSSCNSCVEKDKRRGSIYAYTLANNKFDVFSTGLRNTVFVTQDNQGRIFGTDMGRDLLGDDLPPDEINLIEFGKNYGWPYCYGKNQVDMDFSTKIACNENNFQSSYLDIPAHSAPLGLAFFSNLNTGDFFYNTEYKNDLLVAYHGSWNRSVPTGYKIVRFRFSNSGEYLGVEDFVSGWLQGDVSLGRPVDLKFSGHILYISDDKAGVIYRLDFKNSGIITQ